MTPDTPLLARAWRVLDRGYDWLVILHPRHTTLDDAQRSARRLLGRNLKLSPIMLRPRPAAAPRPARPAYTPPGGPIAA